MEFSLKQRLGICKIQISFWLCSLVEAMITISPSKLSFHVLFIPSPLPYPKWKTRIMLYMQTPDKAQTWEFISRRVVNWPLCSTFRSQTLLKKKVEFNFLKGHTFWSIMIRFLIIHFHDYANHSSRKLSFQFQIWSRFKGKQPHTGVRIFNPTRGFYTHTHTHTHLSYHFQFRSDGTGSMAKDVKLPDKACTEEGRLSSYGWKFLFSVLNWIEFFIF